MSPLFTKGLFAASFVGVNAFFLQTVTTPIVQEPYNVIEGLTKLSGTGIMAFFCITFWRQMDKKDAEITRCRDAKDAEIGKKDQIIIDFIKSYTEALTASRIANETSVRMMEKMSEKMSETLTRVVNTIEKLDTVRNFLERGEKSIDCGD